MQAYSGTCILCEAWGRSILWGCPCRALAPDPSPKNSFIAKSLMQLHWSPTMLQSLSGKARYKSLTKSTQYTTFQISLLRLLEIMAGFTFPTKSIDQGHLIQWKLSSCEPFFACKENKWAHCPRGRSYERNMSSAPSIHQIPCNQHETSTAKAGPPNAFNP